jgi:predicted GNAT family N-acyltransferase
LPPQQGLPFRVNVPVVIIGRLAINQSSQGQGLGAGLVVDALRRSQHLADLIGIRAVEVDSFDTGACDFYLTFGFIPFRDDARHLFLPIQTIRRLKLPPLSSDSLESRDT